MKYMRTSRGTARALRRQGMLPKWLTEQRVVSDHPVSLALQDVLQVSTLSEAYDDYIDAEQRVWTPALRDRGYTVHYWRSGEQDSFGPLSRYAACTTSFGQAVRVFYG